MRKLYWMDSDERDLAKRAANAVEAEAERLWMCWYPEFNDEACYVGHPEPKPEDARLPRKHTECGYVMVVVEGE